MSYKYQMCSAGNIVNNCVFVFNYLILVDHFEMHRNIKLLCCITGTNIAYRSTVLSDQISKQTHRKRDQIYGYQNWARVRGEIG